MNDQGRRFCPRCGTALVAGLPFCPGCGLNSADVGDGPAPQELPSPTSRAEVRPSPNRAPRGTAIVVSALVIAGGLVIFGLLMRPQAGGSPTTPAQGGSPGSGGEVGSGGPTVVPSAPIVGLTIQSPPEGQAVATKEVTVIGIAPPGLTITRDVSLFPDQHATVDGTGHWAMNVGLEEGENELVFRIGDDRSTEQRLRVTYVPQAP